MACNDVLRPGHVQLRVLDMDDAHKHYTKRLGLIETGRDAQGRVYLKAWDEYDWFSVVLREADEPGMDFMAFKVRDTDALDRLEKAVREFGCNVERIPAGELEHCGERVRFDSPTGHTFELYAEKDFHGNAVGTTNPDCFCDEVKGMGAHRFDHCLLYGDDLDGTVKLFREALGFDLTEQVMDGDLMIGAFLTCSNKAHDLAIIRHAEKGKLHHASFYLESWDEVLRAADLISKYDISIDIGPTRHGITRGKTIYFFDPSGNRNEVFAGGSTWYPDQPTITWTTDQLGKAIFYHDRQLNERFLEVVT
ncbi:catechol 2,3-dioxygenase [Mangrovitalea sediminis]|uniref:catechol 2,3-dioxygenase n=1 Tax=Mangrovitalea sediminis TaxID=1982043 RepID=UPI000BE5E042|nr:catechol 2,3-dioxygenase [Mangrovitalea sediminis]